MNWEKYKTYDNNKTLFDNIHPELIYNEYIVILPPNALFRLISMIDKKNIHLFVK